MIPSLTRHEAEELKRNFDFAALKIRQLEHDVVAMESLIAKGYLQKSGIAVVLTESGKERASRL